jgi:UDP-N-acetylmuramoyl-L-alanyl-D-glutamate--2,6-diaminopimelate ligase
VNVRSLRIDSREVKQGDLFIALGGHRLKGSDFIPDAVKNGAAAILVEKDNVDPGKPVSIPAVAVSDLQSKLGLIASRFYLDPSHDLIITGITGTNGKTSVAYFLAEVMADRFRQKIGSIGTLGYGVFGSLKPCLNTTPDVITINSILDDFRTRNIKRVVMEVSSHGLEQGRVNNINFDTAVFTNLSRDHLDYHQDMSAYAEAKKKLFLISGLKHAVINTDDVFGARLAEDIVKKTDVIRYGLTDGRTDKTGSIPDVSATIKHQELDSMTLDISSPWGGSELTVSLSGRFNAYNVLACLGVLCSQGLVFEDVIHSLAGIHGVPGRMECFTGPGLANVFVDYAHTPDALEQALSVIRPQCRGSLVCVFGCGGDRDKGKRPEMGSIASRYSDRIVLTNDNPRSELPGDIINDIRAGIPESSVIEVQFDRSLAIRNAIRSSGPDDCVLIAGKGHETYQEIGTVRSPFSDRQQVRNIMEGPG